MKRAVLLLLTLLMPAAARGATCAKASSPDQVMAVLAACERDVAAASKALEEGGPNIDGASYQSANDILTRATDVLSDLHQKIWNTDMGSPYREFRDNQELKSRIDSANERIANWFNPGASPGGPARMPETESRSPNGPPVENRPPPSARERREAPEWLKRVAEGAVRTPSGPATRFDAAGDAAVARGDTRAGRQDYERAAKADPGSAAPLVRLAGLALQDGDRGSAISYAQRALALEPGNKFAALLAGHADELIAAERKARPKGSFETKSETAGAGGGRASTEAGMIAIPADLRQDYASALAALSPPRSPALPFLDKARQKRALGDKTAALLAATQAIDADRQNAAAWTVRADLDDELGNYEGAIKDASEALKLRPDDAQALRARAYAYFELGNYQAALADVERAIQLDPSSGTAFLYRAMIEEKLGDLEAAKRDYLKAVQLDPSLKPLAADAFKRLGLGGGAASGSERSPRALGLALRAGAIAISLLFILLGLVGTKAGRALTTSTRRVPASDETILDEAPALAPGALVDGHYRVEHELGRGGMGVVYAAVDEALQRRVAIKRLSLDGGATGDDRRRFLSEARLVAQLKHPNIAQILAVIERPELYLVFEFIDGRPLDRRLAEGRFDPREAAKLVGDVCAALSCAHERKIIHRDLKPSNVMLGSDGRCRVMDFGVAHQSASGATFTRTSASGTPPYMAPEQALGSNSRASDLYALAVMTYEMLTGARPFEGPDFLEQKLHRDFQPPSRRDAALAALDGFFLVALDPDPTKRHGDAGAFARAFSAATSA